MWGSNQGPLGSESDALPPEVFFFMLSPEVIFFSCSDQLRLKFILLIFVKMPTAIVGILTFISRINYRLLKSKSSISKFLDYFSIYEQLKF